MSDFIKKIRTATGDKEIDYEALANRPKIPKKVSDLENDTGFITEDGVPKGDIPTKVSELENDSGFITDESVPKKVSELQNDTGFVTGAAIPTSLPQKVIKKSITLEPSGWKVIPAIRNVTIPIRSGTVAYNCTAPSVFGHLGYQWMAGSKWKMIISYDGVEYVAYAHDRQINKNDRCLFHFAHKVVNDFGVSQTVYDTYGTFEFYIPWGRKFPNADEGHTWLHVTVSDATYFPDITSGNSQLIMGSGTNISWSAHAYISKSDVTSALRDDVNIVGLYHVLENSDNATYIPTDGCKYTYEDSAIITNSEVSFVLDTASDRSYAASILKPTIEKSAGKLVFKTDTDPKNSLSATLVIRNTTEDLGVKIVEMGTTFYEYAKKGDVPTQTDQLTNTAGFITRDDLPSIPSSLPQKSKSLWVVLSASSWTFNSEYNVYEYEYNNEDIYTDCEIRFAVSGENAKKASKAKLSTSIYKTTGSIYFEAAEQPTTDIRGLLVISETSGSTDYAYVQGITDDKADIPSKTSDLANDSGFINTDSMASYVDAKLAAYQSTALKLTAPNGDVYVVSVSDSGQIVLTKQVSATNLVTSPITLTANAPGFIDYSLGLEANKYYTVQIKFTNSDGTETVKTGLVKAKDFSEDVGFSLVGMVSEGEVDPNAFFIVYDKCSISEAGEPVSNENAAAFMLSASDGYTYTSAVLESITEAVLDPISFPLTITPSSMTWSSNEDRFISKPYSGSAFDTSKAYNVIGSIVIGGTTYELSVSNEAPIIYGLYDNEDPYIEILVGDDDNHRIYIRSANGYVTIELKSYADESTTCTALTIDSITEGGSPLAGEWVLPITFTNVASLFGGKDSKGKEYTYSGTIGLEADKAYNVNVTKSGLTSGSESEATQDIVRWATKNNDVADDNRVYLYGYFGYDNSGNEGKLPDIIDGLSVIGGNHYEADRCTVSFDNNMTPDYTSLTINSIAEANTAPDGAWAVPKTFTSGKKFSFSGSIGLVRGKMYKVNITEGDTSSDYYGIANLYQNESDPIVLNLVSDINNSNQLYAEQFRGTYVLVDNATFVGCADPHSVAGAFHTSNGLCAVLMENSASESQPIIINSITEVEIPVDGTWALPITYSSLESNKRYRHNYSGAIGLEQDANYKVSVTVDGTTTEHTVNSSSGDTYAPGKCYLTVPLDNNNDLTILDNAVEFGSPDYLYLGYGQYSPNHCNVSFNTGSYTSITINSITKVTA